jgi:hypothetical protein
VIENTFFVWRRSQWGRASVRRVNETRWGTGLQSKSLLRVFLPMTALFRIASRADALCARLNAGLSAVAIVLALLTATAWIGHHPEMFQLEYDSAANAIGLVP